MATLIKRLKDPLAYLDQVRQHLARLPDINPTTRTLLVAGFPNVGKSSFVRSVTRADTPVEPYAFTTKSLFVGHLDYKYLRYQVIDTPGILDHPLEEMNTIEMQSVTALAHLRAAVMFFIDISEQCGYSLKAQCNLFRSIKPLFENKMVYIVLNKMDIKTVEELDQESQDDLMDLTKSGNIQLLRASCATQDGVQEVKNVVCEALLVERVNQKYKAGTSSNGTMGSRLTEVMSRIHVAQPADGVLRETFIPEGVKGLKKYDKADPERKLLARDIEEQNGGAGVFNVDLRENWLLANPEWKYDKIPEVSNFRIPNRTKISLLTFHVSNSLSTARTSTISSIPISRPSWPLSKRRRSVSRRRASTSRTRTSATSRRRRSCRRPSTSARSTSSSATRPR